MAATLEALLARPELALTLIGDPASLPPASLDRAIPWVHSSDLVDPTPFLSDGHVLLTTGTQFDPDAAPDGTAAAEYVARLLARGIAGLGFGTEVARAGTPEALIAACRAAGLPLFEVPYRTPFIAVVQANADELTREASARSAWALAAQRAISLAAMRPDGLAAILGELSRQLGCWVGLLDASGTLDRGFPAEAVDAEEIDMVQREAAELLRRGRRASLPVRAERHGFTLQTLAASGRLHGVLAIAATDELDQAGREVLTSVIALASLGLQQNRELSRARGLLRTGLLHMLQAGDPGPAEAASAQLWGRLPPEPIRVAVLDVPAEEDEAVAETLELWVASHPDRVFFAQDGELVLCLPANDLEPLPRLVRDYELHAGLSEPAGYRDVAHARSQAAQALRGGAEGTSGITDFGELVRGGVLGLLARGEGRDVARSMLAPLRAHDAEHGTELMRTVRVWLENDCGFDATARALGIHRHTARARVDAAGRLLGREPGSFATRAELWAAFAALG